MCGGMMYGKEKLGEGMCFIPYDCSPPFCASDKTIVFSDCVGGQCTEFKKKCPEGLKCIEEIRWGHVEAYCGVLEEEKVCSSAADCFEWNGPLPCSPDDVSKTRVWVCEDGICVKNAVSCDKNPNDAISFVCVGMGECVSEAKAKTMSMCEDNYDCGKIHCAGPSELITPTCASKTLSDGTIIGTCIPEKTECGEGQYCDFMLGKCMKKAEKLCNKNCVCDGEETITNCPIDCDEDLVKTRPKCGNVLDIEIAIVCNEDYVCDAGESYGGCKDCGVCGDQKCEDEITIAGKTFREEEICPEDCGKVITADGIVEDEIAKRVKETLFDMFDFEKLLDFLCNKDGVCDDYENAFVCPSDCAICGDGIPTVSYTHLTLPTN